MISAFNSLKGILALMIFVHHLNLYKGGGSLAVAVFFMLGGFLSTIGYKEKVVSSSFNYKNYLIGKAVKFYPMHLLLLLATVPLMFYGGHHLLKNLCILGINATLIQSWIPVQAVYFSGNAVSWYLSDTLAFVAMFPFLFRWMLLGSKRSKILVISSIATIYVLLWIFLPRDYTHRFFYISPIFRVIDYMVGMSAALCYLEVKDHHRVKEYVSKYLRQLNLLACICIAALMAISFANEQVLLHSVVYIPIGAILLIITPLTGGGILRISILQKFGAISFAFFLVHQVCIRYLHIILRKLDCDDIYILAPIAFILTTIASYFLTYKFDKSISLWLKNKILNRQSTTVQ